MIVIIKIFLFSVFFFLFSFSAFAAESSYTGVLKTATVNNATNGLHYYNLDTGSPKPFLIITRHNRDGDLGKKMIMKISGDINSFKILALYPSDGTAPSSVSTVTGANTLVSTGPSLTIIFSFLVLFCITFFIFKKKIIRKY